MLVLRSVLQQHDQQCWFSGHSFTAIRPAVLVLRSQFYSNTTSSAGSQVTVLQQHDQQCWFSGHSFIATRPAVLVFRSQFYSNTTSSAGSQVTVLQQHDQQCWFSGQFYSNTTSSAGSQVTVLQQHDQQCWFSGHSFTATRPAVLVLRSQFSGCSGAGSTFPVMNHHQTQTRINLRIRPVPNKHCGLCGR